MRGQERNLISHEQCRSTLQPDASGWGRTGDGREGEASEEVERRLRDERDDRMQKTRIGFERHHVQHDVATLLHNMLLSKTAADNTVARSILLAISSR